MSDVSNLRDTILAKSNQLNADDIIGAGITITVTAVKRSGSDEQPIAVHYQGDNGRPYLPCKTMRRVLIAGWGENGAAWVGRSMSLYNEPSVKFGGVAVGGIRISHMTDIGNGICMATNASKGKKKEVIIQPMKIQSAATTTQGKPTLAADKWPQVLAAVESGKRTAQYIRETYSLTDEQDNELHAITAQ